MLISKCLLVDKCLNKLWCPYYVFAVKHNELLWNTTSQLFLKEYIQSVKRPILKRHKLL